MDTKLRNKINKLDKTEKAPYGSVVGLGPTGWAPAGGAGFYLKHTHTHSHTARQYTILC